VIFALLDPPDAPPPFKFKRMIFEAWIFHVRRWISHVRTKRTIFRGREARPRVELPPAAR